MKQWFMDIFLASYNIVSIIILLRFLRIHFDEKESTRFMKNTILTIIMGISVLANIYITNLAFSLLLGFVIYSVVGLLIFEGKLQIKSINIGFYVLFSFISELLAAALLTSIFGNIVKDARENTMYMFLGGSTSKLILMILVEIIIRFRVRKVTKVSVNSWVVIISIPIISVILSIISVYVPIISGSYSTIPVFTCFFILYINVIMLYLFDSIIIQVDNINQFKIRENTMRLQQEQYKILIDGYEQVKKVRHDMIGHLIVLEAYHKENMIQKAIEYIHKLHDEIDFGKRGIISGNVAVDAIINNRKAVINQMGIHFNEEIVIPRELSIEDIDLSIILVNLINNAIEACERVKEQEREIMFTMKHKEDSLFIEIRNTYDITTIRRRSGKFISSKLNRGKDELGTGIENAEEIIKRYNGAFLTELEEDLFIVKAMIPVQ